MCLIPYNTLGFHVSLDTHGNVLFRMGGDYADLAPMSHMDLTCRFPVFDPEQPEGGDNVSPNIRLAKLMSSIEFLPVHDCDAVSDAVAAQLNEQWAELVAKLSDPDYVWPQLGGGVPPWWWEKESDSASVNLRIVPVFAYHGSPVLQKMQTAPVVH